MLTTTDDVDDLELELEVPTSLAVELVLRP